MEVVAKPLQRGHALPRKKRSPLPVASHLEVLVVVPLERLQQQELPKTKKQQSEEVV